MVKIYIYTVWERHQNSHKNRLSNKSQSMLIEENSGAHRVAALTATFREL